MLAGFSSSWILLLIAYIHCVTYRLDVAFGRFLGPEWLGGSPMGKNEDQRPIASVSCYDCEEV